MRTLLCVLCLLVVSICAHANGIPLEAQSFNNATYRVKTLTPDMGASSTESLFNSMASSRCRYVDKLGSDLRGVRVLFICER